MEYSRLKVNASHATTINKYKNLRTKLIKCDSNIYFNKECLDQKVIPAFAANISFIVTVWSKQ
jgi:hypothetical protein